MKRRSFIAGLGSLPIAATSAGSAAAQATPEPAAQPVPSGEQSAYGTIPVNVMTFNIWIGGDQVGLSHVVDAIRLAKADVVGIQEAEGNIARIAASLGWDYFDVRMQIVSRFPIIDPPGANGDYILIEPIPGGVFAMSNVHLPSDPYGPQTVIDGTTADDLMKLENETRVSALKPKLAAIAKVADTGIPAFFTGDFNAPSGLDWIATTGEVRGVNRFPFAWPESTAMVGAGFVDSYRAIYSDPDKRIGYTWTPGYPAPLLRPGEPLDRIDFVYYRGSVVPTASQIVGEIGGTDVDIPVTPYPSDHRSVVSSFTVTLAEPPVFVSVTRRSIRAGEKQTVRFRGRGSQTDTIAIVAGDTPRLDQAIVTFIPRETWVDGSVCLSTEGFAPGPYTASLSSADGKEVLASVPFWVLAIDEKPAVRPIGDTVTVGEKLNVAFSGAPGNRWDWIALLAETEKDPQNYAGYVYTDARVEGNVELDTATMADYLTDGTYRVVLFEDDGYVILAESKVDVRTA